jgi:ABC-type enterochelin transport system permease subunit
MYDLFVNYLDGKCGVCGDAYTGPRYHEIGGKYATNVIVRQYLTGSIIDVKILVGKYSCSLIVLLEQNNDRSNETCFLCYSIHRLLLIILASWNFDYVQLVMQILKSHKNV